ncbi:DNA mismatch repair protein MutT [Paenibacillus antibioticophila]|uniref:DNA mismatch repair protein MutT n=1 Tax=Paenibacillus antibioticophila TaxID=1274374 RepID=A0A920CJJ1_9BACL|nr:NUDIX domain-containing protein [Paenibacillus antibioticophila]GIO39489.1 DNA mismatch repair protein MutT [Paenibacillus antibioticophila]
MTQYVKDMRKLIGTKPLLLCGASVIIFDTQDRVLMLHRSDNDTWCFPGGAMDLGEKAEETAKREVYEETGLIINDLELFGVFSGEELHYIYPHGDEVYIVDVVYKARQYKGHVEIDNESKAFGFFDLSNLPQKISPPVIPIINTLLKQTNEIK